MKKKTFLFYVFSVGLCTLLLVTGCNKSSAAASDTGKNITIIVDGGGVMGNYNTTSSMEKSDANPYPYNELELLAKEYSDAHPGVTVQIAEVSRTGDRTVLVPLLRSASAPDIIYQNFGTHKNAEVGTDYIVPVTKYLDEPNPYVPGNQKWSDLFVEPWLRVMRSMDGEHRFIPIDATPNGIVYNKEMFAQAGITEIPDTYAEFDEAMDKLNASGVIPFMAGWHWYDIFTEGSLLTAKVDELDVLLVDGVLDAEEIARGYEKGLLSMMDPEYTEWLRIMKERTRYYPTGWQNADVMASFLQGQVAMVEVLGVHMRMMNDDTRRQFDIGVFPFPLVTTETSPYATSGIVRGNAGYSTCWQITNTAVKNGSVEVCVDFLRFLTTPENNARLVNSLVLCTPAVLGADPAPLFEPLMAVAQGDMDAGFKDWHALAIESAFDAELVTYYEQMYSAFILGEITAEQIQKDLDEAVRAAIRRVERNTDWDKSRW